MLAKIVALCAQDESRDIRQHLTEVPLSEVKTAQKAEKDAKELQVISTILLWALAKSWGWVTRAARSCTQGLSASLVCLCREPWLTASTFLTRCRAPPCTVLGAASPCTAARAHRCNRPGGEPCQIGVTDGLPTGLSKPALAVVAGASSPPAGAGAAQPPVHAAAGYRKQRRHDGHRRRRPRRRCRRRRRRRRRRGDRPRASRRAATNQHSRISRMRGAL
eukprot:scaffold1042_cov401-Prasinococcus_capsulatus_cf.AAC.14